MKNKFNKTYSNEGEFLTEYHPVKEYCDDENLRLEEELESKIHRNKGRLNFIPHLRALKNYLFDKNVKWYRKSVVVAALIYFVTPVDSMPDITPIIGFLDDLGVVAWTVKFLGEEIKSYYD